MICNDLHTFNVMWTLATLFVFLKLYFILSFEKKIHIHNIIYYVNLFIHNYCCIIYASHVILKKYLRHLVNLITDLFHRSGGIGFCEFINFFLVSNITSVMYLGMFKYIFYYIYIIL